MSCKGERVIGKLIRKMKSHRIIGSNDRLAARPGSTPTVPKANMAAWKQESTSHCAVWAESAAYRIKS